MWTIEELLKVLTEDLSEFDPKTKVEFEVTSEVKVIPQEYTEEANVGRICEEDNHFNYNGYSNVFDCVVISLTQ